MADRSRNYIEAGVWCCEQPWRKGRARFLSLGRAGLLRADRGRMLRQCLWSVFPACVCLESASEGKDLGAENCPCTGQSYRPPHSKLQRGGYCEAWDRGESRCSGSSPPSYCDHKWCYVDPENCQRDFQPSAVREGGEIKAYSYTTCGNLDTYSPKAVFAKLTSRTIRVSYPATSFDVWPIVLKPDGSKAGAIPEFMHRLFDAHNVTFVETPVSSASLSKFVSPVTACVHEIALNGTDICMADTWVTTERLLMSDCTPDLFQDMFYLVAPAAAGEAGYEMLLKPFKPFSTWVWVCILIVCVLLAVSYYLIESDDEEGPATIRHAGFVHCLYEVVLSVFSGCVSTSANVDTNPARVLHLAFGFFILIVISTYTASLTNHLMNETTGTHIESIDDAVALRLKICGVEQSKSAMTRADPRLSSLWVTVRSDGLLSGIDEGICDAAIVSQWYLKIAHAGLQTNDDRHCSKIRVGSPLMTLGNALCVRDDIEQALSAALMRQMEMGFWDLAASQAQKEFVPPSRCASEAGGERRKSSALAVQHIAGTLVITGFAWLVSMVWFYAERSTGKRPDSIIRIINVEGE